MIVRWWERWMTNLRSQSRSIPVKLNCFENLIISLASRLRLFFVEVKFENNLNREGEINLGILSWDLTERTGIIETKNCDAYREPVQTPKEINGFTLSVVFFRSAMVKQECVIKIHIRDLASSTKDWASCVALSIPRSKVKSSFGTATKKMTSV